MIGAGKLLESSRLAIVQGVGYPNPNRSHFESMAIWHTARFDPEERNGLGWIGRGLDERPGATSLLVGSGPPPVALRGRRAVASALERIEDFTLAAGADPRKALPETSRPTSWPRSCGAACSTPTPPPTGSARCRREPTTPAIPRTAWLRACG